VAAVLLKQNPWYGLVVAVSLFCAVVFASLIGACGPFIFDRLGLDPALAAGPAVATLNDITGILIYFGLAHLFLGHLVR
jgi:magnesium transporter